MTDVIVAKSVKKSYVDGDTELQILKDVNLRVKEGEQLAILGRSGSGKSTLLHILAGLDDLDSGEVRVAGQSMNEASSSTRAKIRSESMGFVYQFHHLLPEFTTLENVAMPLWIRGGADRKTAEEKSVQLLESVGMSDRLKHMPHKLSGGEKQRVAVARALVVDPAVVLGDELTGNLDAFNAEGVLELLESMRDRVRTAFVVVTHDSSVAKRMERTLWLEQGILNDHAP